MPELPVFSEQLIKALLHGKSRKIGNIKGEYAQKRHEIAISKKVWLSERVRLLLVCRYSSTLG
jgi:hypothetical protein